MSERRNVGNIDSATTLLEIATDFRNNGQEQEAVAAYKQLVEIYVARDEQKQVAFCLQMIGVCYKVENNLPEALHYLNQAIDKYQKVGDGAGVGNSYRDIGLVYSYNHRYEEALCALEQSENYLSKTDDLVGLGMTQAKIGLVYVHQGDLDKAEVRMLEGMRNVRLKGAWFIEMTIHSHLAALELKRERFNESVSNLWSCLGLIYSANALGKQKRRVAQVYGLLAHGYLGLNNLELAKKYFNQANSLIEEFTEDVAKVVREDIQEVFLREKLAK